MEEFTKTCPFWTSFLFVFFIFYVIIILARRVNMVYDILIIGGGPAGISAGIYAKRANKSVAILEKFAIGGEVNLLDKVDNYLGFHSMDGQELAKAFKAHAKALDLDFIYEEAVDFDLDGNVKKVITSKNVYQAKAVIFALGANPRALGISGEERFVGRGVSYCAVCDGNFYKDKNVAVVGSGDSAVSDAVYLSGLCKKVYVLTREKMKLFGRSEQELDRKNIIHLRGGEANTVVGKDKVTALEYTLKGKKESIKVDGVFVAIGRRPQTESLEGKLDLDEKGYIVCDERLHASVKGVFACGDARNGLVKQIATAVSDGAVASMEAIKYVSLLNAKSSKK